MAATEVLKKYRLLGITYMEIYHRANRIISQQWL